MADNYTRKNISSLDAVGTTERFLYTDDLVAVLPQDIVIALGTEIQRLKDAYSKPLMGEFEYTTTDHGVINTTLFGNILGPVQREDIDRVLQLLDPLHNDVTVLLQKMDTIPLDASMKAIYLKSLEFLSHQYDLVRYSLPIEAEKGGYVMDPAVKKELVHTVDLLQQKVYGPSLIESPALFRPIVASLNNTYTKFHDRLSIHEQESFRAFLDILPVDSSDSVYKDTVLDKDTGLEKKELSVDIAADVARRVVDLYSHYYQKNYGLPALHWQVLINDKQSSMSVDGLKRTIYIPGAVDKKIGVIPKVSVEKLLKILISHEWERHGLSAVNTAGVFGQGFSGADYLPTEEGLAKIHEGIAVGAINKPTDLAYLHESVSLGQVRNLLCSLYPCDQALHLMRLYLKLKNSKGNAETLIMRGKRTIAFNQVGLNRKELSYQKGVHDLVEHLSTQSLDDAVAAYKDMAFKLSLDDTPLVRDLTSKHHIASDRVVHALFLGRMLFDKILYGKGSARAYTNPLDVKPMDIEDKKRFLDIKRIVESA